MNKTCALLILIAFALSGVFGIYLTFGHEGHGMHCLFSDGQAAVCDRALLHLSHWESAYTAIVSHVLFLLSFCILGVALFRLRHLRDPVPLQVVFSRVSERPCLLQELFSRGILNRKEGYIF